MITAIGILSLALLLLIGWFLLAMAALQQDLAITVLPSDSKPVE